MSSKRPIPKTTLSKAFVNGSLPYGETNDNTNGDTTSTVSHVSRVAVWHRSLTLKIEQNMSKMANRSMEEEIWLAVQQRMDQRVSFR